MRDVAIIDIDKYDEMKEECRQLEEVRDCFEGVGIGIDFYLDLKRLCDVLDMNYEHLNIEWEENNE